MWGRGGYIETVWAEMGAGGRYNISNLSKGLKKFGGSGYIETLWAEIGAGRRSNL